MSQDSYPVIYLMSQKNEGNILIAHDKTTVTGGGGYNKQSRFSMITVNREGPQYNLQSVLFPELYLAIDGDMVIVTRDSPTSFYIDGVTDDGYYQVYEIKGVERQYISVTNSGLVKVVPQSKSSNTGTRFNILQIGIGQSSSEPGRSSYLWNKENGSNLQIVPGSSDGLVVVGGGGETPEAEIHIIRVPGMNAIKFEYALKSKLYADKYLAVNDERNAVIVTDHGHGPPYPKWFVDWNCEGYYTIRPVDAPNRYIAVDKDNTVHVVEAEAGHPPDKIKFVIHFPPQYLGFAAHAAETQSGHAAVV